MVLSLTRQEFKVLQFASDGLSNHEIADNLFISICTVKRHKANIMSKLGITGKDDFRKFLFKSAKMVLENHKNGTFV
jgi:DNA-binding NarL/FixJ family response regulator